MCRYRFNFSPLLSFVVVFYFTIIEHSSSALENVENTRENMNLFDYCLDGMHHKSAPGPESALYNWCTPWKNRSCCTHNTTERIHDLNLYQALDYTQCQPLSESCKEYFIKDQCFYECSPNVGPWVEKVEGMKVRKEHYKNVPLCKSDCDRWFDACKNDFICSRNWIKNGKCANGSSCVSIADTYHSAKSFCEEIWNHSWSYTPDDEPCMKMWFDPTQGNPNDVVTRVLLMKPKQFREYAVEGINFTTLFVLFSFLTMILIVLVLIRNERLHLRSLPDSIRRFRSYRLM